MCVCVGRSVYVYTTLGGYYQSDIQVERRETCIIYYIFLYLSLLFDFFEEACIEYECVWNILQVQT